MSPLHMIQLLILSTGVYSFIVYIYLCYYTGLLAANFSGDHDKIYDYVIVGSGTAGSVIAHRLATETNCTFIILEAGGRSNPLFEIPVLGPLLHSSVYDWNFETEPQKGACLAMTNQRCKLTQGKIVGGSSKVNNMIHFRGNLSMYADWFHKKYTEDNIRRHFTDYVENNILHLNEMQYESELAAAILDAAIEMGYDVLDAELKTGFRKVILSQNKGRRWTASDKGDVAKHLISNAFVEKVTIHNNIAKGVIVNIAGTKHKIFANSGVILTAGTYNTPKILQLSGIGPAEILNRFNIPIVKDLPVGYNLQDHVATGFDLILFNDTLTVNPLNMLNIFNVIEYFLNGRGPLTTGGCEVVGFIPTKGVKPDLQFMVMPVGLSADRGAFLRLALGIKDAVWDDYFRNIFDMHAATILPVVLHPKSKGTVFISSKDAKLRPSIDPKFLSERDDVETLINGLKFVQKFLDTQSMKKLGAFMNPQHFPGCESYDIFSDKYWECYIRHLTLTSYHPIGTCSMAATSTDGVVDTSFKVFGVTNLYVTDASVLPTMPSGNINAVVAMMASVFFDDNIKVGTVYNTRNFCHKSDFILEYVEKICI